MKPHSHPYSLTPPTSSSYPSSTLPLAHPLAHPHPRPRLHSHPGVPRRKALLDLLLAHVERDALNDAVNSPSPHISRTTQPPLVPCSSHPTTRQRRDVHSDARPFLPPSTLARPRYTEWWTRSRGDDPIPIPCFRNARYEPYLILPNLPSTPIYSEAFTGYGKNKIELVTHLRFAGFKFYALAGAFAVHMPHVKSAQKVQWEAGEQRHQMDRLYQRLVAQLISRFKRPRTPSCHPGRLL